MDVQPEHEVLHEALSNKCNDILVKFGGRPISSVSGHSSRISSGLTNPRLLQVSVGLDMAAATISQKTHPEKLIIKKTVENIRRFISGQST
jgi:hypothetical protein